ncbi:2'-5' RNA ligase family protein [Streptomyces sp. NPDC048717]|uniref:2'-5' RNA ligase family protein n=1 Tax=Streptomyces sp. NPDC048717 TaxID=3154928 RepID=UPI003432413A
MTGVVDEVADLITPGAFAHTLATRPVKTVWHHSWTDPIGVVLEISEWRPGDARFATIPNWPAEAGALVATVQFNLRTQRGRDVYEQVRQWHEHGEAAFSIGYRVPPSGATKRSDGVRLIHKLDLYEVSPVLHGAHPMTRSLEVKAGADASELERKTTTGGHLELKTAEPQVGRGAMVALYVPGEIADRIAHREGTSARDLHVTLADLGDADRLPGHPDDLTDLVATVLESASPLTGRIGGIGRFPDMGAGEPVFVPVDVPGLASLRQRIVERIESSPFASSLSADHDFTPHITLGYGLPLDTAPAPPIPITFDTVHVVRGRDSTPVRLRGPLAPAQDTSPVEMSPSSLAPAPAEEKSARRAVRRALAASRQASRSARATVLEAKSRIPTGDTVSPVQPLPASYEDIRERVGSAVRGLLAPEDGTWCCVEATYPDRAIVSVHQGDAGARTYAVPYDVTGTEVSLGTPEPVELATVVIPEHGSARPADSAETADNLVVRPAVRALSEATVRVQAADSAERLEPIRASVSDLLDALSAKGLDIGPEGDEDEDEAAEPAGAPAAVAGNGIDLWDDPYDEPHDDGDGDEPDDVDEDPEDDEARDGDGVQGESGDDGTVRLDATEVKARLAAIQL